MFRGLSYAADFYLEVVSDADGGHGDDFVAVRLEVIDAEVRGLQQKSAVLHANVIAGAEFVGYACAEESTDVGVLLRIQCLRLVIANGGKNETAYTSFHKRIEAMEVHVVDIGSRQFLLARVDTEAVGIEAGTEGVRVLCEGVIQLQSAARCEHVAVAGEDACRRIGVQLRTVAMDLRRKDTDCAYTHVLSAFLSMHYGCRQQQSTQPNRLLHSADKPSPFLHPGACP
jgi:hypothetical protein